MTLSGRSVLVLEQHAHVGEETSSRNSEVIHAGLYYRPGSLKARLCVTGRRQLIEYCDSRQVPYRLVGKWILASDAQSEAKLLGIQATARANGVALADPVSADAVRRREPGVRCSAGLYSPGTGIIDSHALMTALQSDLEQAGGMVVCHHRVERIERMGSQWSVRVRDADGEVSTLETPILINSAGLHSVAVARTIESGPVRPLPEVCLARGNYFTYAGRLPVRHLLYPTPEPGGLGIHLTMDLGGQLRFGPDVQFLEGEEPDYRVDVDRHATFVEAIHRYLPDLDGDKLFPGYAGVRPKVKVNGRIADDFLIETYPGADWTGLVNLFGIESPGLTSCLAIADEVYDRLSEQSGAE
ncbi:dehydrogenase [Saccharospirillum salsuginis]|uniref:Dehydrogenase n=2 Tax=Saccharospirillum salsuginis TaxID=418750 RepID=A0A918NEC3_9GAMM|nr:dehydrogenase [Saccharospirillum salsuginis]